MTITLKQRKRRNLHDGDTFTGPFHLGWDDDGTRLLYPYVQVFAPEPSDNAPAGHVVVRLLDNDFDTVGQQVWPARRLTHAKGIRLLRSISRGPQIT